MCAPDSEQWNGDGQFGASANVSFARFHFCSIADLWSRSTQTGGIEQSAQEEQAAQDQQNEECQQPDQPAQTEHDDQPAHDTLAEQTEHIAETGA